MIENYSAKEISTIRMLRYIVGTIIAISGFLIVIAVSYDAIRLRTDPSLVLLIVGSIMLFVGGYIMFPAGTERIADSVHEHFNPVGNIITRKFGRRATDTMIVVDPTPELEYPPTVDDKDKGVI